MFRNIYTYALVFIIPLTLQSQTYESTYKVHIKPPNYDSTIDIATMESMKRSLTEAKKIAEYVEFKLIFNTNNSLFFQEENVDNYENRNYLIFNSLVGSEGKYFASKKITLNQRYSFGELFLINIPKYEWKITSEIKKIGKYNCYKAVTFKEIENSQGKFKKKVIAWFTVDLPFNFGPKDYNNLPGLIIELDDGDLIKFRLNAIKKLKTRQIEELSKGRKVELTEFNVLSKKIYNSSRKR